MVEGMNEKITSERERNRSEKGRERENYANILSRLLSECMKKIRCKYWLLEREWPKRTSFLNNTNG